MCQITFFQIGGSDVSNSILYWLYSENQGGWDPPSRNNIFWKTINIFSETRKRSLNDRFLNTWLVLHTRFQTRRIPLYSATQFVRVHSMPVRFTGFASGCYWACKRVWVMFRGIVLSCLGLTIFPSREIVSVASENDHWTRYINLIFAEVISSFRLQRAQRSRSPLRRWTSTDTPHELKLWTLPEPRLNGALRHSRDFDESTTIEGSLETVYLTSWGKTRRIPHRGQKWSVKGLCDDSPCINRFSWGWEKFIDNHYSMQHASKHSRMLRWFYAVMMVQ